MIRLHTPDISELEEQAVQNALRSGWVSTAGPQVNEFEKKLSDFTGSPFVVAFNSGTAALQIALITSGVTPGDIVLVPDLCYIATLNAIHHAGAVPLLMEVNEMDGQMDVAVLEKFLESESTEKNGRCIHSLTGKKIAAIVPLWAWGNSCDIEKIKILADTYHLELIEDAAAGIGTRSGNKHAGTFGKTGILSFNGNKILTTGGGGALLTADNSIAQLAQHLSVQAKVPGPDYVHDQQGFNNRMTNLSAALGIAQMERLTVFLERKKQIFAIYQSEIEKVEQVSVFPGLTSKGGNGWLFQIRCDYPQKLQDFLKSKDIETSRIWTPMSELKMNSALMRFLPEQNAQKLFSSVLCLPSSSSLQNTEMEQVIEGVKRFFN